MRQLELKLKSIPGLKRVAFAPTLAEGKLMYQELERLRKSKTVDISKFPLTKQCLIEVQNGEITFTESIDWLIERGMNEDAAFRWAMRRFSGADAIMTKAQSPLMAVQFKTAKSKKRRKAA